MSVVGRPPLHPEEIKRVQFNTRLRHSVREILRMRGSASGRSLSEEIEKTLEDSVRDNPIVERLDRIIEILLELVGKP
jgi:predicted HicB family RNase H-like nuclease